jgi:hypothetical protein
MNTPDEPTVKALAAIRSLLATAMFPNRFQCLVCTQYNKNEVYTNSLGERIKPSKLSFGGETSYICSDPCWAELIRFIESKDDDKCQQDEIIMPYNPARGRYRGSLRGAIKALDAQLYGSIARFNATEPVPYSNDCHHTPTADFCENQ